MKSIHDMHNEVELEALKLGLNIMVSDGWQAGSPYCARSFVNKGNRNHTTTVFFWEHHCPKAIAVELKRLHEAGDDFIVDMRAQLMHTAKSSIPLRAVEQIKRPSAQTKKRIMEPKTAKG